MMKKKAFTLVELLVVISIIALLMSILMPALSKVKEGARRVACQANLHQLAFAFDMYQRDNNGYYLSAHFYGNDRSDAIYTYKVWGGVGGTETLAPERLLNRYIGRETKVTLGDEDKNLKVFSCPSDKGMFGSSYDGPDRLPTAFATLGTSYLYNSTANNNDPVPGLYGKKVANTKNTSELILAGDKTVACYSMNWDPAHKSYWHNRDQLGWGNVIFTDYHAAYIQVQRRVRGDTTVTFQRGHGWTFIFKQ